MLSNGNGFFLHDTLPFIKVNNPCNVPSPPRTRETATHPFGLMRTLLRGLENPSPWGFK